MGWKQESLEARRCVHVGTGAEVGYRISPERTRGYWRVYFQNELIAPAQGLDEARHCVDIHAHMRLLKSINYEDPQQFPCLKDGGIIFRQRKIVLGHLEDGDHPMILGFTGKMKRKVMKFYRWGWAYHWLWNQQKKEGE